MIIDINPGKKILRYLVGVSGADLSVTHMNTVSIYLLLQIFSIQSLVSYSTLQ